MVHKRTGWSRVFVRPVESDAPDRDGDFAQPGQSLQETIGDFLAAIDDGTARDRHGRPFTGGAAQDLHWYLGGHLAEALGAARLDEVRRRDVETLAYGLGAAGMPRGRLHALARSTRALYDYAIERRLVLINPAERIALPDDEELPRLAAPDGHPALAQSMADHVLSLAIRVATLGFLITALIFLGGSL